MEDTDMSEEMSFPLRRRSPSPVPVTTERVAFSNAPVLTEKKQIAQELYYKLHADESPLRRSDRLPVHERLGHRKGRRVRFDIPLGTNTFNVLPKNRSHRNHPYSRNQGYNRNHYGNYQNFYNPQGHSGHISRSFRAQDRINRIRQQQAVSMGFHMDGDQGFNRRPFRLRRFQPHEMYLPSPEMTMRQPNPRRFKIQLNPARQAEIRDLQAKTPRVVHNLQYKFEQVHATAIKLNHRFSQYT